MAQQVSDPRADGGTDPAGFSLAPLLEPALEELAEEITRVREELATLPPLSIGNSGLRAGYHSSFTPYSRKPLWILVDLRRSLPIDTVVLMPARGLHGPSAFSGYGFPRRFQIDLSDDPTFERFQTIARETARDFPNPGPYPYVADAGGRRARYVRIFAAQRWRYAERMWAVALAEVFVLSRGVNVAADGRIDAEFQIRQEPIWVLEGLNDNQTDLGLPVGSEPSRSHGYHSRREISQNVLKWVQVDLGEITSIDEIRLIPAQPSEIPVSAYGFPSRFEVEVGNDTGLASPAIIIDHSRTDFLSPGNNVVRVLADGHRGRYVRVTATKLYDIGGGARRYCFALAEIQVVSEGHNVALGKPVEALDVEDMPPQPYQVGMFPEGPMWDPQFLVDGYSSRNRLIELEAWLRGLSRRGRLEAQVVQLEAHRATLREDAASLGMVLGAGMSVAFAVGLTAVFWFSGRRRRRQLRNMRRRLARDLHDDIGSSLGSIRLTSQMAQGFVGTPGSVLDDLKNIENIAAETADSMRDIIWLLGNESLSAAELVKHMRLIAERMLVDRDYDLNVIPGSENRELPLDFRRNMIFAFKEALHNAVRHAGARRFEVAIDGRRESFGFCVRDNGCGFDPTTASDGHGLKSLRDRARTLQGQARIESTVGEGASVDFRVPVM